MTMIARYVISTVFVTMLASVMGLWVLQMVFAYLGELDSLTDAYTFFDALKFVGYRAPYFLVQFMPTGVLLGAAVGLGMLAANSELVVMRAAGISIARIVGMAILPALLFVLLALMMNQFVVPKTNHLAGQIAHPDNNLTTLQGYWTLSQDGAVQKIINIGYADSTGNLQNVKEFTLADGRLVNALSASRGAYSSDYTWQLTDIHDIDLMNVGDGRAYNDQFAQASKNERASLVLPIDKSSVYLLTKDADDLSMSELYAHRQLMAHQGAYSHRHELAFWQKLLSPFAMISLVLVACSFVFGSLRSQSLGARIVLALLVGLLFSYLQDLSGFVAIAYRLSPWLMAALPALIGAILGVYLINQRK